MKAHVAHITHCLDTHFPHWLLVKRREGEGAPWVLTILDAGGAVVMAGSRSQLRDFLAAKLAERVGRQP